MKTLLLSISLIFLLLFSGCTATKPLKTLSGKPEVFIPNKAKKEVTDALVSEMVSRGFTIKSVSDYSVVFSKPLDSFTASLFFGSRYDVTPEHRPTFMIVESGGGVRIVLTNQIITNPGSAFERVTDASTGETGESWNNFLNSFSKLFRGRIGIQFDNKGVVNMVANGSPAMQAGILVGDKLLRVDGISWKSSLDMTGEPDSTIEIVVFRDGKEIPFKLIRKILKW